MQLGLEHLCLGPWLGVLARVLNFLERLVSRTHFLLATLGLPSLQEGTQASMIPYRSDPKVSRIPLCPGQAPGPLPHLVHRRQEGPGSSCRRNGLNNAQNHWQAHFSLLPAGTQAQAGHRFFPKKIPSLDVASSRGSQRGNGCRKASCGVTALGSFPWGPCVIGRVGKGRLAVTGMCSPCTRPAKLPRDGPQKRGPSVPSPCTRAGAPEGIRLGVSGTRGHL